MKKTILLIVLTAFSNFFFGQINLTEGLIAHWPLDGNALDISGNELHGALMGAVSTQDRFSNEYCSYDFNGSADFIQISNNALLKKQFPFSISLWVYVDEFSEVSKTVFQNDEADVYTGFWILYNSLGRISAGYGNGQGETQFARVTKFSDAYIETGNWNHIAANFNGLHDIDLYLNGILNPGRYSGTAQSVVFTDQNSTIGRDVANEVDPYHNGKIDDVRYYDRALTEDEIEILFEGEGNAICENVLPSIWGAGSWDEEVLEGKFIASSSNDAILASGTGDLTIEIFSGDCGGASLGIYNTVASGEIERIVIGELIAGQEYSYQVSGGTSIHSKVKTYANSRIRGDECGQVFEIGDQIHALRENELYDNPIVQVTGFTYRFEDLETEEVLFEVRNQVDGHTPQLSTISGLIQGHSYNVQVAHRVLQIANGVVSELYSDFGTSCTIHLNYDNVQEPGCMDVTACNFDADANLDDGSCLITGDFCGDGDLLYYYMVNCLCECEYVSDFPFIDCPECISVISDFDICGAYVEVPQPYFPPLHDIVNDYNGTSDASGIYPVGITAVAWTITDECGNSLTCVQNVEVIDETPPLLVCGENLAFEIDDCQLELFAVVEVEGPNVSDNCGIESIVNDNSNTSETELTFEIGSTILTWAATDVHGNITQCTQTIIINDFGLPFPDLDNDGIIDKCDSDIDGDEFNNESDCDALDADIFLGASCDDGDPLTQNDTYDVGCVCVGTGNDYAHDFFVNLDVISKIYPNPNSGENIFVDMKVEGDSGNQVVVEVFNSLGYLVFVEQFIAENTTSSRQLSVNPNLSTGIYVIKFSLNDKSEYHKLIIER